MQHIKKFKVKLVAIQAKIDKTYKERLNCKQGSRKYLKLSEALNELIQRRGKYELRKQQAEKAMLENKAMGELGLFGPSSFGQLISGVLQVAAVPVTRAMRFATNHPYLSACAVLATQIIGVGAAPIRALITILKPPQDA